MRMNCDSIRPLLAANAESAFLNGLASSFAGISDLQRQHTTRPVTGDCSSSTHLSSRPPCCVGRHCATCLARPRELYGARLYPNSGNSPLQPRLRPTIHLPTAQMLTTSKRCTGTGGRTRSRSTSLGTSTSPAWTKVFQARRHSNRPLRSCLLVVHRP